MCKVDIVERNLKQWLLIRLINVFMYLTLDCKENLSFTTSIFFSLLHIIAQYRTRLMRMNILRIYSANLENSDIFGNMT